MTHETWSALWMAGSVTSKFIGTAVPFQTEVGPSHWPTTLLQATIINGAGIDFLLRGAQGRQTMAPT